MSKTTHVPALDGIRGIAIIAVMFFHSSVFNLRGGFIGVDIFFVLSGFLISSLLIKEFKERDTVNFKNFYMRRVLRLLPAMVMLITAMWIGVFFLGARFKTTPSLMVSTTFFTLFYMANWVLAFQWVNWPAALTHLWSLAIEEQFYLVWPFILYIALRRRCKPVYMMGAIFILILFLFGLRWHLWAAGAPFHRLYFASDTRLNSMLIGCLLSIMVSYNFLPSWFTKSTTVLILISTIGLCLCFYFLDNGRYLIYHGGFELVGLLTAFLITGVLYGKPLLTKFFELRFLTFFGKISYGLYLWHAVIFYSLEKIKFPAPVILFFSEMGISIIIATASYYVIEKRFLKFKTRYTNLLPVTTVSYRLSKTSS